MLRLVWFLWSLQFIWSVTLVHLLRMLFQTLAKAAHFFCLLLDVGLNTFAFHSTSTVSTAFEVLCRERAVQMSYFLIPLCRRRVIAGGSSSLRPAQSSSSESRMHYLHHLEGLQVKLGAGQFSSKHYKSTHLRTHVLTAILHENPSHAVSIFSVFIDPC